MSDESTEPREEAVGEGEHISPELLRLIQRVAHREYLLDGAAHTHLAARTAPKSPARRRPAIGSAHSRAARGTTARKVTWS